MTAGGERASFVIRKADRGDLPAVLRLIRDLAVFEHLPPPDDEAGARLAMDYERSRFALWVAERGGEVVAYALFFSTYSTFLARPTLYLEDLYVRPDARRAGIATALLRGLARYAVAIGCGRFEWSVLDWNEPAQAFYRQLGAEVLPDWRICRLTGEALVQLGSSAG